MWFKKILRKLCGFPDPEDQSLSETPKEEYVARFPDEFGRITAEIYAKEIAAMKKKQK